MAQIMFDNISICTSYDFRKWDEPKSIFSQCTCILVCSSVGNLCGVYISTDTWYILQMMIWMSNSHDGRLKGFFCSALLIEIYILIWCFLHQFHILTSLLTLFYLLLGDLVSIMRISCKYSDLLIDEYNLLLILNASQGLTIILCIRRSQFLVHHILQID